MTSPDAARFQSLQSQLLSMPPQERDEFLDRVCGGDALLRAQLETAAAADPLATHLDTSRLGGGSRAEATPDSGAGSSVRASDGAAGGSGITGDASTIQTTGREGPGVVIGPYRLMQVIGEGGFGTVWLAEQERPVRRRVALKIIKLGMDTRQVIARFEAERQALALMDHPHIARVLDAGATEAGRPYFVMEYVKGVPITQYCDQHGLTPRQRLELFVSVCQAVQHAHQKGVIHRDLKPSNVLVARHDDRPVVKVIDFGIAKATGGRLTEKTVFTEIRQMIGTPAYMSPEQAGLSDQDVDTRSDVYSLGVLLYELLTGSTPFAMTSLLSAGYAEIQRIIREVDPPRPSTRLSALKEDLAAVASSRRTEPSRLTKIIRGDLDWIVMKCLEKDRARRYETANGLAADIARHLAGEPVSAAPPGAGYRMRKFVRRHRGVVLAGTAVAAALVLGAAAFAWQASVARHERDLAQLARDEAVRAQQSEAAQRELADEQRQAAETAKAESSAINAFLLDMLGAAKVRDLGRDARVSQVLDRAATNVGEAFVNRPAVEAAVRRILGSTYLSLSLLDQAEPQIQAALKLNRDVHGERSVEYIECLSEWANYKRLRGDTSAAVKLYVQLVALAAEALGPESSKTLSARSDYANTLMLQDKYEEAATIFRETLDARRRTQVVDSRDTQILLNSLAVALHNQNQLDEAEALYREAVDVGTRVMGRDDPDTLTARMNLGSLQLSRRKFTEADPVMHAAYNDIRRVYGPASVKMASAAHMLGQLHGEQGRWKEALPYFQEALSVMKAAQVGQSPELASATEGVARALQELGDARQAVAMRRELVDVWTSIGGAEDKRTLGAKLDLANALASSAQMAEAGSIFADLLPALRRVLGDDSRKTMIATNSYAVLLMRQDRYADAEPYLRRALEASERVLGADDRDTVITLHNLAAVARELGRKDEALTLSRDVVTRFAKAFGPEHPNTAMARSNYARALEDAGRTAEALHERNEAIAISTKALGEESPVVAGHQLQLAGLLNRTGKFADAEPICRKALETLTAARGPVDRQTVGARVELGRCLAGLKRFGEAEPLLVEGHARQLELLGKDHATVARTENTLAEFYAAWNEADPTAAHAADAKKWRAAAEARAAASQPASAPH